MGARALRRDRQIATGVTAPIRIPGRDLTTKINGSFGGQGQPIPLRKATFTKRREPQAEKDGGHHPK
jgi:hypothetical protein